MNVSFGRYMPYNSPIHKMDPRLKIAMIIILIVAIFFPTGYTGYIILTAIIFGIYALARLRWKMLLKLSIPIIFIFLIIFIIDFFLLKGGSDSLSAILNGKPINVDGVGSVTVDASWVHNLVHPQSNGWAGNIQPNSMILGHIGSADGPEKYFTLSQLGLTGIGHYYRWRPFWFSEKAIYSSLLMGWRIFLMITLTTIITATTQPLEITIAIEDLLSPLKLIGIPVHILATIVSIALRMIPDLIDDASRIMKAQASRGIDMKNGNPKDKTKAIVSLIIPLLVSSFQKAEDLAYAMDARNYDPHAKRTRYRQFSFNWMDWLFFITISGLAIFTIVCFAYSPGNIDWHIPYIDNLTLY